MAPTPLQTALKAAPDRAPAKAAKVERELFLFRLGGLLLAVPSDSVREVVRLGPLTPLPRMAAFVLGVAAHRGEVLPVLDLLRLLGLGEVHPAPRARIFVSTVGSWTAAFLTDEARGLVRVLVEDVLPAPVGGQMSGDQVLGVVRVGKKAETATVLDLSRVLHVARQRAVAR